MRAEFRSVLSCSHPVCTRGFPANLYTWMSILQETVDNGCFAIVVDKCLEANHEGLRRCLATLKHGQSPPGLSCLQTSIAPPTDDAIAGLRLEAGLKWVKDLKVDSPGKQILLQLPGHEARLKVLAILDGNSGSSQGNCGLLVEWNQPNLLYSTMKNIRRSLGKEANMSVAEFDGRNGDNSRPRVDIMIRDSE